MFRTSRRDFIKSAVGATALAPAVILTGCSSGDAVDRELVFSTFDQALAEAHRLASKELALSDDVFSLSQVFAHCAQSIEYSMTGFPKMKSAFFQNTAGSVAFSVFSSRGRMSHNLTEGIPGAPPLAPEASVENALIRLEQSIAAFSSNSTLKPHFAYGELSKRDYESAHIMHLANHFSSIDA